MEETRGSNLGVHAAHCCQRHGCKYGNKACPVVKLQVAQEYPCEWCMSDDELATAYALNDAWNAGYKRGKNDQVNTRKLHEDFYDAMRH